MAFPIEDYLAGKFFGNTLLQYIIFFGICAASILLGKIIYYFFKTVLKRATEKTKSDFDDVIVEVIEKPLILLIVIVGFYIGYKQLALAGDVEHVFGIITKNLVTIAIAWFAVRLVDKSIEHYLVPVVSKTETDLDDNLVPLVRKLVKYLLITIAALILLSNIGINVTSAIAGLGIGGLAVALAAQETLKNILGGVAILTDKPFKLGSWVEIDKYQGTVVEIGLRSTRLKTLTGEFVTVPNNIVASTPVVDHDRYKAKKINFVLGLAHDSPVQNIEKAKNAIRRVLERTERVARDTIEISFAQFSTYSLDVDARFEVSTNDGQKIREIKDSVNMGIKREFTKEKIMFAFPTQMVEIIKK